MSFLYEFYDKICFIGIAKKHCNIAHIFLVHKVHQELKNMLVKNVIGKNLVGLITTFAVNL